MDEHVNAYTNISNPIWRRSMENHFISASNVHRKTLCDFDISSYTHRLSRNHQRCGQTMVDIRIMHHVAISKILLFTCDDMGQNAFQSAIATETTHTHNGTSIS